MLIKCKMCGGDLHPRDNATTCECEFCGTTQTIPKLDNDRRANLYDRANHLRRQNEYDKAASIFDQILQEDRTDAEAYWSLVLCRYGIEYVEDPVTKKRIPTVNRAQFTSIFADEDYKAALEYADAVQKGIYEQEAKAIDDIQKGILDISKREKPFDVFICYKETDAAGKRTPDSVLANDLYHQLTREGFKVFFSRITLEDKLGQQYEPYIFAALNSAKVMVVLGTKPEYFNAVWVKNEWKRYLALIKDGAEKTLVPAYKDMDPYDLPEEFSHLQAQDMGKLGFMQDLIRGIRKILNSDFQSLSPTNNQVTSTFERNTYKADAVLDRAFLSLRSGNFQKADDFCEQVLNHDAYNARAYLCKLLIEHQLQDVNDLSTLKQPFDNSFNYQMVMQYGDTDMANLVSASLETVNNRIEENNERINSIKTLINGTKKRADLRKVEKRLSGIDDMETQELLTRELEKRKESLHNQKKLKRAVIIILLFVLICLFSSYHMIRLDGHAMEPLLLNGEVLFVSPEVLLFNSLKRSEIVQYQVNDEKRIGRIVGMPGDHVSVVSGELCINGNTTTVVDPSENAPFHIDLEDGTEIEFQAQLKSDYFLIMPDSISSKTFLNNQAFIEWIKKYLVPKQDVSATVKGVVWPLARFRSVE